METYAELRLTFFVTVSCVYNGLYQQIKSMITICVKVQFYNAYSDWTARAVCKNC